MADQPVIDGIVLAAGRSRRMGEPKPLLEIDGQPFLEHAVKLLRRSTARKSLPRRKSTNSLSQTANTWPLVNKK